MKNYKFKFHACENCFVKYELSVKKAIEKFCDIL